MNIRPMGAEFSMRMDRRKKEAKYSRFKFGEVA